MSGQYGRWAGGAVASSAQHIRRSPLVIVRNRSWPAVSHICSLTHLLSISTFFILKSIPMVVMKLEVKESSAKRSSRQLFPTPTDAIQNFKGQDRGTVCVDHQGNCILKAPQHAGLSCCARTAVPNKQQLDQVVIILSLRHDGVAASGADLARL